MKREGVSRCSPLPLGSLRRPQASSNTYPNGLTPRQHRTALWRLFAKFCDGDGSLHGENAGLILTPAELLELTGYKQRAAQARWLEHNGFTYRVAANGRIVVLREHAARILDGAHDATVVAVPDFS